MASDFANVSLAQGEAEHVCVHSQVRSDPGLGQDVSIFELTPCSRLITDQVRSGSSLDEFGNADSNRVV